jgi:hypothetical protein
MGASLEDIKIGTIVDGLGSSGPVEVVAQLMVTLMKLRRQQHNQPAFSV